MGRTVAIGAQGFADIREMGAFLVDKTDFIRQWWESGDSVTLITRPRRFGKTLNLNMLDCFFSTRHAGRADLFEGLAIWDHEPFRRLQGTIPVIAMSFADVKAADFETMRKRIAQKISMAYRAHAFEVDLDALGPYERDVFRGVATSIDPPEIDGSLQRLCELLLGSTGSRAIVLLDEYDTPLQEAWLAGYWDEAVQLFRSLFNATFKTNEFLLRAILTGITRVSKESIFSDLNNLKVCTSTTPKYETAFGFTEDEVFSAMDEMNLDDREGVRYWYDGFTFGDVSDMYNPWSITNYLDERELDAYWANSSGNGLVSSIVRSSDAEMKSDFETLLDGGKLSKVIDEQIVFADLDDDQNAVWSLLAATGYLSVSDFSGVAGTPVTLKVTNFETMLLFDSIVRRWFSKAGSRYNRFVQALLRGDVREMNLYMNDVALDTFSTFDSGRRPAESEPERFYHGFVLGLLVELRGRYLVRSNRESGYRRYDVMLIPCDPSRDDGIVIEFKVIDPQAETTLAETVAAAHAQIDEKGYAAELVAQGVPESRVRAYGFAFEGKRVLIG